MQLVLFSTPAIESNEVKQLNCFFENGLRYFHLRKPGASRVQFQNYIKALPSSFHPYIVIHDHYELTKEFDLKGIHLPESVRRSWGLEKEKFHGQPIISTSIHGLIDLQQPHDIYEYIFVSPIFDSLSKENYKAAFDTNELQEAVKRHKAHVVFSKTIALGGIEARRWDELKTLGFDGAAVLGAVWQSANPYKAFIELMHLSIHP